MATRATAEEVRVIIDTSLEDPAIESYIVGANAFLNKLISSSVSEVLLKEIERWLTAHFISVSRERLASKEEAGGAKVEYAGTFGEGLRSTPYGQTAIDLDYTGKLASVGKKTVQFYAVESFDN